MATVGKTIKVSGPLIVAENMADAKLYDVVRVSEKGLIGEIIELTDGPLISVACNLPDAKPCKRKDQCITLPLWQKYDTMVHDFFYHITLKDLLEGNY